MTVAYATVAELATFLGSEGTPDAGRLLERASELVDTIVDVPFALSATTGLPTDTDVAAALRDATCAVVEAWLEVGESNDIDGLAGQQIAVQGFTGKRAPEKPPRAVRLLKIAGLHTGSPSSAPSALVGIDPGGRW